MNAYQITALAALLLSGLEACTREEETRPQRKNLQQAVFASGHLEQTDEYLIAATVEGTLRTLTIREGDSISRGQVLLNIKSEVPGSQLQEAGIVYRDALKHNTPDAPQLAQLGAQMDATKAQLELDRLNFERYKALRAKNSVSQLEFEKATLQYTTTQNNLLALEQNFVQVQDALQLNAERSLQQLKTQKALLSEYEVRCDKPGIVLDVLKKQGELVRKGEVIARIGSGRHIMKLFIAEDDITRLSIGQKAVVQMNNYPDTTFTATVTRILPAFDQTSQSYLVEAVFIKPPPLLLSGTQLQANIFQNGTRSLLVIPVAALVRGQFVELQDGTEKPVKTGQKVGNWVEIKAGLSEHDIILLPKDNDKKQSVEVPGA